MFELRELTGHAKRNLEDIFNDLDVKIKKLKSNTEDQIKIELYEIGKDLKKKALELIDEPKTGKIYTIEIGGQLIVHQASAPGEAPAILTGRLRRSINYKVIGSRMLEFASYDVLYARDLEYRDLINQTGQVLPRVEPRPFLSAAFKSESGKFPQRLKDALVKASQLS